MLFQVLSRARRAHILGIDDFRRLIREHKELNTALQPQDQARLPDNLEGATRLHIKRVCEKCIGNITKAADILGSDDYQSRLPGFNKKSRMPMVRMPWLS